MYVPDAPYIRQAERDGYDTDGGTYADCGCLVYTDDELYETEQGKWVCGECFKDWLREQIDELLPYELAELTQTNIKRVGDEW